MNARSVTPVLLAPLLLLTAARADAQSTIRLSEVGGDGGDSESAHPSTSQDGRYTVFGSGTFGCCL